MQFVIDAVYAFAHALQRMKKEKCRGHRGLCNNMKYIDGGEFYRDYLLKVKFTGKSLVLS